MRPYWWIPILALSHASMLWFARSASHLHSASQDSASSQNTQAPDPEDSRFTPGELLRRYREREAALTAAANSQVPWSDQVAAARTKIPATADFPALVATGVETEANENDKFSPETVAAFGLWMDRDPSSALTWIGDFSRDHSLYYFGGEAVHWLGEGGHSQLNHLLKTYPLAREFLLDAAETLVEGRGIDFTLALARSLEDPRERLPLLESAALDPATLKGQLARFRDLLDEEQAAIFLSNLAGRDRKQGLLVAEIRAAGFPAAALAAYEEQLATSAGNAEEYDRYYKARMRAEQASPTAKGIVATMRDYLGWSADARDGRLTPEELIARVKQAKPEAASVDRDLRSLVFRELFPVSPQQSLQWYQASVPDWQPQFEAELPRLKPEQIADLVTDYPGGIELSDKAKINIQERYALWFWEDRAACRKAIQRFPDGPLKESLIGIGNKEDDR